MVHDAANNTFSIRDGASSCSASRLGDTTLRGDVTSCGQVTVGGAGTTGARTASVVSTTSSAKMVVQSGGSAKAQVQLKAPAGANTAVHFSHASQSFETRNDAAVRAFSFVTRRIRSDGETHLR